MARRILIVSEYWAPDPGGMATYASELVPRLGKLGFEIRILVPFVPNVQRLPMNSPNVTGILFPSPPIHFFGRFTIFPALLRYGNLRQIDAIVDISVAPYGGVNAFVAKMLGIPYLIGAHGNEVSRLYPEIGLPKTFRAFCNYAYRNATAILPNSQFTASLFAPLGIDSNKLHVATLGADTNFYTPGTPTSDELTQVGGAQPFPRLLCAGQLKEMKGQKFLIQALSLIARDFPEVSLDLAGSGVLEQDYRNLARELGLTDKVRFHGNVDYHKLRTLYRSAAAYVMPTQRDTEHVEGFGLVAAEALACGCPVAATNYGGQTEFVIDGKTGILFDSSSPQDIADKVCALLRNQTLCAKIAVEAPQFIAAHYTWDKTAERWAEIIEQCISNKR